MKKLKINIFIFIIVFCIFLSFYFIYIINKKAIPVFSNSVVNKINNYVSNVINKYIKSIIDSDIDNDKIFNMVQKEDGDIVLLRKKMRLSAPEAALLLLAGTRVLLKKPACAALDSLNIQKIAGTIAGDDTIFCAVQEQDGPAVVELLNNML